MKHKTHFLFTVIFLAIPSFAFTLTMLNEKGLFISTFYFLFFLSWILLPLAIIRPFYWGSLILPFLFLVPGELIHIIHYDGHSTLSAFTSSAETNYNEVSEFVHNYRFYFFALIPAAIYLTIGHFIFIRPAHKLSTLSKTSIVLFFVLTLSAFTSKNLYDSYNRSESFDDHTRTLNNLYSRLFTQNFPYAYLVKTYQYIKQQALIKNSLKEKQNFRFGATTNLPSNGSNPVHVLVIGETSRANNWSLNDYAKITNPLLSQRDNLLYCKDTTSIATHTKKSIQITLSRATPHNLTTIVKEKSLISAFNEAGYTTAWLSNQNMTGGGETYIRMIAKEADQTHFIGGDYTIQGHFDEVLIPVLKDVLESTKNQPTLIIIHTIGSHEIYRMRYPERFEKFVPASKGDDYNWKSPGLQQRLLNSYDNSILYTDFILDSFISTLDSTNRPASLTYFSDHGENILDNGTHRFGHGGVIPTKYVTDIPMMFWVSEKFKALYPQRTINLDKNCSLPISANYTFDTMLGIGSINLQNHEAKFDLTSNTFKPSERFILSAHLKPISYSTITE